MKMRLSEFVSHAQQRSPRMVNAIAAFGDWWKSSQMDLSYDYPEEMAESDWWDQFLAWHEINVDFDSGEGAE